MPVLRCECLQVEQPINPKGSSSSQQSRYNLVNWREVVGETVENMYVQSYISRYQGNRVISGVLQTLYFTLELVINVISPVGLLVFTYHHLYN